MADLEISQHKRMNLDRPNADLVPVRSLLECYPSIPAYVDLQAGQVNQCIIEPLEKALDKCGAFAWEYSPKVPKSYGELISSHLRIQWASLGQRLLCLQHPDNGIWPQRQNGRYHPAGTAGFAPTGKGGDGMKIYRNSLAYTISFDLAQFGNLPYSSLRLYP